MSIKKEITVIVPVYNVELYIEACVNSILEQTFSDFEVILIDDGSTDSSGERCDEFEKKDERVRVIHKENKGLSSARNRGVKEACGRYICFVDSDDMLSPNYLEVLHRNAVMYNADISWCGFRRTEAYKDEEKITKVRTKEEVWSLLTTVGAGCKSTEIVVAWNKLIRTDLAKRISFPDGKWHEDEFWIHRLLQLSENFVETTEKLYFYRSREDSIIGEAQKEDIRHLDIIDALEERIGFAKKSDKTDIYVKVVSSYRQTIIMQYHMFGKKGYALKLKARFWKSLFSYPIEKRLIKSYFVFSINAGWYYKKYWR